MKLRKPYDRERVPVDLTGQKDMTDRSFGNDTDVNKIVARFSRTGELPPGNGPGHHGDVTAMQQDLTEIIEKGRLAAAELHQLQIDQDARQQAEIAANKARLEELEALHALQAETDAEA